MRFLANFSAALREFRSRDRAESVRVPDARRLQQGEETSLAIALMAATGIGIADALAGQQEFLLTGFLALPVIFAGATTGWRSTALVALYALTLAALSGLWNEMLSTDAYALRVLFTTTVGGICVWAAANREGVIAAARGGAVLIESLALLDSTLDAEATIEQVAWLAVPDLADVCIVDLVQPDGTIRLAALAAADDAVARRIQETREQLTVRIAGNHPIAQVVRSGERLHFDRFRDREARKLAVNENHLKMIRDVNPQSILIVPMQAQGETIGTLSLGSLHAEKRYGKGEVLFAEELARRAAIGIYNARLHEEQTQLASIIQKSLLPPLIPRIDELEIATRFRPAGAGEIGGDFYDLLRLGASTWALVIGDVCGKGPEAAALTLSMRDALRASKIRGDAPQQTLALLNDAIRDSHPDHRFCTSAYVRFDLDTEPIRMTVCNGGHPKPLLLRSGGEVTSIGAKGTLLGIYPDPDLTDQSFELRHGDALMLYTDGLIEIRPSRGPGVDPRALLDGCAGRSAEEIASLVVDRALDAHSGHLDDDMAVVVLRRV